MSIKSIMQKYQGTDVFPRKHCLWEIITVTPGWSASNPLRLSVLEEALALCVFFQMPLSACLDLLYILCILKKLSPFSALRFAAPRQPLSRQLGYERSHLRPVKAKISKDVKRISVTFQSVESCIFIVWVCFGRGTGSSSCWEGCWRRLDTIHSMDPLGSPLLLGVCVLCLFRLQAAIRKEEALPRLHMGAPYWT